ncbi:phosphoinositide 3-kinase regulatory subunit 4 isoform X1 [Spodoptera frugiperda]|uniref:non-specific serine/threonine protein kinase n=1 Tax=Spodoptera frugiperda TaxID=7108 RepID=A0A9R0EWR4_SPOFR|nr:phosphoinositide 3-kinase regulatory subunit 4 isoform X1 [Spodoptera frugiperda]XP_050552377.1 phosphoinositide 3-kinase regulatory subunit 4 isoform X1 [Spodoptera frugiperda]
MGNQLVGVAPSQIYPVEHYLSDHVDLSFDQSLGSTRFLKVARARSREGLVVVKVFAVHDPSLPLAEHKERILKIKEQLASAFNCLPYQRVILTDKAGLLMREYCKFSVYDRMSTRPFLTTLEKKWITFQVLYALHRMHKLGICHGDIKLENIMVTSWLWVLLTDIASFKPTFLPDDNPADFSYFFDTSRRRLCYVAPERFVRAPDPHNRPGGDDKMGGLLLSESPCKVGELVPSMDIFSAGCALLELWNDGTPALDLPGLLAYRNGEDRPSTMTLSTDDEDLKNLLHSMTERNPKDRKSAELYLDEARGKLFPEYFYSFLQSYMLIFSGQPILPADEKILRIHQDIKNIIKIFTQPSDAKNYKDLVEETTEHQSVDNIDKLKDNFKVLNVNTTDFDDEDDKAPEIKELSPDSEGLILITSLVTSCIRGLHHCTSKLYSLEILQLLCENTSSETILDRILPYIIELSHSSTARVRARAVSACGRALCCVRGLPRADCNVFPEYILPELAPRATDPSVPVRIAYANNIARLAETAVRFLDQTQNMVDKEAANINYETELSALHEMVRSTVSYLLTDSQAVVKRALVENGITKLCIFFGKQKANDVILSHMVTFLNDKEEAALRGCFFERVVGVAAYVGHHAAPILVPLLQQGLTDQSEWIISKALRATTNLAELGLLNKQTLCDLVAESAVFLAHPNLWIRQEVCGLVSCVASLMNPIDVHCKILPLVWPHLKHKLIQVERPELLLESLSEPIPRKVLDAVLRHGDVDRLVHTLRERRNTRLKVKQGTVPQYSEMGQQLRNLFRRLASDGMTEHVENQLLAMSAHLIKIQGSSTQHITEAPGRLVLPASGISRAVQLDTGTADAMPHVDKMYASTQNRRTHKTSGSQESHMNTEWQHMFGHSHENPRVSESVSQSVGSSSVGVLPPPPPPHHSQLAHSASYVQYSMAPCRVELRDLTARMQQKYQKSLRSPEDPVECSDEATPPPGWRPGNQLLAYLHEHKARVNQLVCLPASRAVFASCSDDGTVRLWDAARLHTHAHINRSKSMYNRNAGPVVSLAACEAGQSLVAATQESVFVLRVDGSSSRMSLSQGRQLESDGDDALCVAAPAHGNVIAYATLFANIVGWDLRAPGNAWKLQGDLKQGVTTCLYADPTGYLAVGTSSGAICVWDLRFHLPITSVRHPNSERVRRIVGGGCAGAVWVAGERDAAAWSLESTQRTAALWTCTNSLQPLQYTPVASQYISSIYCGTREGNRFVVTGGSDQRLRYWDLEHPEDSYILLHAHNDALKNSPGALKYRSRIIDGTTVIQECCKLNPSTPASMPDDNIYRSVESRSFYHTAPITDLTVVEGSKPYLVSASADGVINVWK